MKAGREEALSVRVVYYIDDLVGYNEIEQSAKTTSAEGERGLKLRGYICSSWREREGGRLGARVA